MKHKQKELKVESRKLKVLGVASLLIFSFSLSTVSAQTSINATGGNASGSGGSTSYSVGQVVYTTNTGTNGSVAQGVQQSFEISVVTGLEEAKGINLTVSAYPNPTTDYLTLEVDASTTLSIQSLTYQLFDMQGKLLQNEKITGNQTSIVMSNLLPSTYFVKVIQNNKEVHHVKSNEVGAKQFNVVKTFKIIKN
jgi:hypothetical protein